MRTALNPALLGALLLASACSDSGGPRSVPTTVQIGAPTLTLADGDSARLAATVLDQDGKPLAGGAAELVWSSTAPAVASVVGGTVRANRPGTAQVTAQAGSARGSVQVTVSPVPREIRALAGDGQRGAAGAALGDSLAVRVLDRHGDGVPGVAVSFVVVSGEGSLSAPTPTTGADGVARTAWVLGTRTGAQSASAQGSGLGGAPALFQATATAAAAAQIRRVSGDLQGAPAGSRLPAPLVVQVTDRFGNAVAGAPVEWRVTAGGGSVVAGAGATDSAGVAQAEWTLGAAGEQLASATVAGVAPAVFTAGVGSAASLAPTISSISPATLAPGATATLSGANFGASADLNTVTIAGVRATVTAATATQLTVLIPERGVLPCEPTRPVAVEVRTGGLNASRAHPLTVAVPRALAIGQSLTLSGADLRCNQLPLTAGRYLLSVHNVSQSVASVAPVEARSSNGSVAASLAAASPARVPVPRAGGRGDRAAPALGRTDAGRHARVRALDGAAFARRDAAGRGRRGISASRSAAAAPEVGDTLSFRLPYFRRNTVEEVCADFATVRGRVVYAGAVGVVVEDVANPAAGQNDSIFRALGAEFDGTMLPILRANFGDPLAFDGQTDANGRLFMVFSRVVNEDHEGVAGFVTGLDLLPPAECQFSNQAEIFYAQAPMNATRGFAGQTADNWLREMRSVVIHEVKHITANAERFANPAATTLETSWLEESTAMVAEELYARAVFGFGQRANVGYRESVYCEFRPSTPACKGGPLVMAQAFGYLSDFHESGGSLSPLGSARGGDATFYGSGWSFVRWIADQYATAEPGFFRALIDEPSLTGIRNLEARSGAAFATLLSEWSLALALDDRPGFTPASPRLRFPGWDLPSIFTGLNGDLPQFWPSASPLVVRQLAADGVASRVSQLRGGGAALFEVGVAGDAQVLELRGAAGIAPTSTVRMTLVRVQ